MKIWVFRVVLKFDLSVEARGNLVVNKERLRIVRRQRYLRMKDLASQLGWV